LAHGIVWVLYDWPEWLLWFWFYVTQLQAEFYHVWQIMTCAHSEQKENRTTRANRGKTRVSQITVVLFLLSSAFFSNKKHLFFD